MMRSLFSGVSGLKTHQTRMDVIGNNIANVNTTAYKAQNMVFSDLLYQQTQAASGANADTGRGGINARQIGLGSKTAAINTAITRQGSAQSTNNPWDVMISGESFFIVNSGKDGQNFFTRDGSFTIDGAGNLVMASTGYKVMGWQVDEETGEIQSGPVAALQVMQLKNLTAPAEASTKGIVSGILDKNDTNVHSKAGLVRTLQFFDARGYSYTAKFSIHALSKDGQYYVQLDDITDSNNESLKDVYKVDDINKIAAFGSVHDESETKVYGLPTDDSAIYTDGPAQDTNGNTITGSLGAYQVNENLSEILAGFSNNPMFSDKTAKVKGIDGVTLTAGTKQVVKKDTEVTVTDTVTLSKDILQTEYGITYDDEKKEYYYNKSDGNNPPQYTRTALTLSDPVTDDEAGEWATALGKLGASITISKDGGANQISLDEDHNLQLTYEVVLKTSKDSTYDVDNGKFGVQLVYPDDSEQILEQVYGLHSTDNMVYSINYVTPDGHVSVNCREVYNGNKLEFYTQNGKFLSVGDEQGVGSATLTFAPSLTDLTGDTIELGHFHDISIDFSTIRNVNNGKVSTVGFDPGDGSENNLGTGRKEGALIGIEVAQDGKIRASYDNGLSKLLGQIAVTKFANAAGLAKAGNNLYKTTLNSGEFDGVGMDITSDGEGTMESGVLEMSNVDLAGEFTEMITTQRGFQANSRIITTSDSMLEELVNLKR